MMDFTAGIVLVGQAVETIGVAVIVIGAVHATVAVFRQRLPARNGEELFHVYRRSLGRAMMLGLDFLVAGDIIGTVVVSHSILDVAGLGLLVLIRTILVFTIHLEVEGRWPWQARTPDGGDS